MCYRLNHCVPQDGADNWSVGSRVLTLANVSVRSYVLLGYNTLYSFTLFISGLFKELFSFTKHQVNWKEDEKK
jgi:hypothetical protein